MKEDPFKETTEEQNKDMDQEKYKDTMENDGEEVREKRVERHRAGQAGGAASRRRRRKKRISKSRIITFFAMFFAIVAVGALSFAFTAGYFGAEEKEPNLTGSVYSVTIPEGASTSDIAKILKERGLIGNTLLFRIQSRLGEFDGTYQQGTYEIDKGLTSQQIMELLQTGVVYAGKKITVPEGFSVQQIAQRAEEMGVCTAEEFIRESNTGVFDYPFLENLPDREHRLEGYLFPSTYFLEEETTANELIHAMLNAFDEMYTKEYQDAVAASGFTLDEIVTIASVIEKEIKVDDERSRAAGVVYNRLDAGMPLQMDATVLYAMGIVKEDITNADLEIDSPYNTYQVKGLPLGPIANPGELSLRGAIFPEENKYLYYVVEARGQSNHVYCETYDEFLEAKAKYKAS